MFLMFPELKLGAIVKNFPEVSKYPHRFDEECNIVI